MAIQYSDYYKYDMSEQEYYIKIDAVLNKTAYTSDDIGLAFGENIEKHLKIISHSVYRLMYNYRKVNRDRYAHKKWLRKKIYDNEYEEVTALINAMIEAVKGAIESGMDLNAYTNEPKETFPSTVYDELRQANLLDKTHKVDTNLDIIYTSQDETYAT